MTYQASVVQQQYAQKGLETQTAEAINWLEQLVTGSPTVIVRPSVIDQPYAGLCACICPPIERTIGRGDCFEGIKVVTGVGLERL
jgi:hypothetical protein